ncbi:P-loop containing nucleoside triphosphate hydrolase protein, partial [Lichtheimia hyalospora FSU 10163]
LVSLAPTGSGKTALIELAMIRILSSVKSEGKIIYMAPTKALCSQKAKEWSQKFKPLGATCKEYTGDTDFATVSAIKSSTIIVTTPEKWDSMTRRWKDHKQLMSMIKLFVIDEVHILNENRGAVLEACVSRMKTMQHKIRFFAISATVPNVNDIADWLQGEALTFSEEYRPVKLERIVYGFPFSGDNMFVFDKRLDWKLLEMIENHSNGKPVLIFCSTRKSAQGACETLSNTYGSDSVDVKDRKLKELFKRGIGYHHAGLDARDRAAVEGQFTNRRIRVVATTSTLALGVNLPTYLVIIKSTKCYQSGSMVDYSDIELLQMIGRAGRPGMEDAGCAVIMTTADKEEHYKTIVDGTAPIESCLHLNLIEHLMSEICLGTITDNESQSKWLRSTFLHVRIQKNPNHYNIHNTSSILGSAAAAEEILQVIGQKCFDDLVDTNLVEKRANSGRVSSTYGDAMDKYYIKYNTMRTIIMATNTCSTVRDVLELVSHAEEFTSMRFTTGEKPFLNSLQKNPNLRFPTTAGKVSSIADKIFLVIQVSHTHLLVFQIVQILHQASRVTKCIIDCSIHDKDSTKLKHALDLHQSLQAKMWPSSSYVIRQIDKIGKQMSTTLVKAGVTSFEHLRQMDASRIEVILHRNPPFGNQVRNALCISHKHLSLLQ